MTSRFRAKRCTVVDLLQHRRLIEELAEGKPLPGLDVVGQRYRALEANGAAMCALILDNQEPCGLLVVRRAGAQGTGTAVLDTALAHREWSDELCKEMGALVFSEAKSMAEDMGAAGLRIPHEASGPASAVLSGAEATGTGTNFFQAFAAGSKYEHDAQHV